MLRRLIRLVILFVSLVLFGWAFVYLQQSFYNFDDLIPHEGQISRIDTTATWKGDDKIRAIILGLNNDSAHYTISRDFDFIYPRLIYGDSIRLFTKPVSGWFGNAVAGSDIIHFSKDSTEVFHLIKLYDGFELINFHDDRVRLKNTAIIAVVIALVLLFSVYFLRPRIEWK